MIMDLGSGAGAFGVGGPLKQGAAAVENALTAAAAPD
jgi:hypothetical protein